VNIRISAASATLAITLVIGAACSQRPSGAKPDAADGPMFEAFRVAFGKPAPYTTVDDSGDHVTYSPQALVDVAPGVAALISKSEIADRCQACAGALSIDYLQRGGAGFTRAGTWPGIAGKGRYGEPLPWTIRTDLNDGPTLVTRNDQKQTGCSSMLEELITLTPKGPVKIATVVTATAIEPTPDFPTPGDHEVGKVVPVVRGQSFAVVLSGTLAVRQVYRRDGDVFITRDVGASGC